jgi:peptide/nickel transport system permease protein
VCAFSGRIVPPDVAKESFMSLTASIFRRVLIMIPMLIGVTLLAFIVSHLVPSDPLVLLVSEKAMNNPEIVKAAVEKWGLDRSLPEQYFYYLGNLLRGNLGDSFKTRRPVAVDLLEYFPATVELGLSAMLFAVIFGLPLGIAAAVYSGKWVDHMTRFISLFGASMPPFWSGLMALFLLWYKIPIMASPGRLDTHLAFPPRVTGLILVDSLLSKDWVAFTNGLHHLILPSIILGWFTLAIIARVTRASLLEVLQMDYIRTARAKGLRERRMIIIHALRNALIPTLTVVGLAFAWLMAGAIMTETIFAWPGIGRYAVEAAANLDYPAVLGTTVVFAVIFMFTNLVVDILYCVLDPRIRQI